MRYHSKECSKAIELFAANCFQSQDGGTGSWYIKSEDEEGNKTNPDLLAIAKDLRDRFDGEDMIVGGDVLQPAVIESLFYGDSFLQLGFEKDGGTWGISSSIFMPPLSIFVVRNDAGKLLGYYQETIGGTEKINFHPFKIIQFSYLKKKGLRYGNSYLRSQAFEDWDNVRDAEYALAKVAMEHGVSPWLHILAEGKTQEDLQMYERRHQEALNSGEIITNYYLANTADIRKAASDSSAIAPLAQYVLDCRRRMIPAGFPAWIFTELGYEGSSGNDLNGQPALTYSQLISAARSSIGQGIKKIIMIELLLKKGGDWVQENGKFEIAWEPWIVTPGQLAMKEVSKEKNGSS
jgi:hypothetical protein